MENALESPASLTGRKPADEGELGCTDVPDGLSITTVPGSHLLLLDFSSKPAHSLDPLVRPLIQRYWITAISALLVFNTALASSTVSAASPQLDQYFGPGNNELFLAVFVFGYVGSPFFGAPLSETFGRRPVNMYCSFAFTAFTAGCIGVTNRGSLLALRFLCGLFGAIPMTVSAAVCADVWAPKDRGTPLAYYSVATFAGPALGPILGSFAAARLGWRSIFIIQASISACLSLAIVFTIPETYPAVLISKLANEMSRETESHHYVSRLQLAAMATRGTPTWQRMKSETWRIMGTPFVMLFTEPTVVATTLFFSMVYGLLYLTFPVFPIIFQDVHHLAQGDSSLPFLSILIGAIVAVPLNLSYQRKYLRDISRNGGVATPEMRLPMCQVGGLLMCVSFLWLGWSGYKASIPWIVPTLSGIPLGVALTFVFRALATYTLDAYPRYAASATSAQVVIRSICGGVFPLLAKDIFNRWACTMLACIMLVIAPIPFIFARYGARIRANSRFAHSR